MLMMLAMLACGEKSTEDTSVVGEPSTEDTSVEDTNTEDTNTEETDTQEETSGADAINVGDLVITEIMKNPCGLAGDLDGDVYVDCADPGVPDETGEWFEVHNASGAEVNLNGLLVHEMDDGDSNTERILQSDSLALHLLQHIRDESHRFAITGHRARRAKARKQSLLEGIEGVGPKRRRELLRHFGSAKAVESANVEEIAKVSSISANLAETIYRALHPDS